MAGRKLAVNTTALDEDGRMVTFPAGTVVSDAVAQGITNPKAWGSGEPDVDEPAFPEGEPSESWKKAQLEAYASDKGIDLDGASTKADILAKLA